MAASKHTHARAQCSPTSAGLAQARPKYCSTIQDISLLPRLFPSIIKTSHLPGSPIFVCLFVCLFVLEEPGYEANRELLF